MASPVTLRPTPSWVREACGGFPASIRSFCPSAFPAAAGHGLVVSIVTATPGDSLNLLQLEAGRGESDGDQHQNRPPRDVGVFLASGDLDRALPTIFPRSLRPSSPVRDGLANRTRTHALSLGRRRWAGIHGKLSLAPSQGRYPLVYFHYLVLRWGDAGGETAIGLHAWEPFTETVQTLHALVDRLTPAPQAPLSEPRLPSPSGGLAMTRTPGWLRAACRALRTRPICPTRMPAADPGSITVFHEPSWRSGSTPKRWQDLLDVAWGAPYGSQPTRNHPPRFLHLRLSAGDVPVARQFAGPIVQPRDGLMLSRGGEAGGAPVLLGHPRWGGHRGVLVLGDCFSTHLCFRWSEHGIPYQIDIHGWEPFTQTVAALHNIVLSLPSQSG